MASNDPAGKGPKPIRRSEMTPQPQIVTAPDSVALARNATPLRFSRRQSMPAADGTTAAPGVSTFLELMTIGPPAGALRSEAERL